MKHQLICIALLIALSHSPVQAQTNFTAPIVEQLENQGYTVTKVRRTLLGRILIVANLDEAVREIVINRKSGEILHDQIFRVPHPDPSNGSVPSAPIGGVGTSMPGPGGMGENIGGGSGGGGFGH